MISMEHLITAGVHKWTNSSHALPLSYLLPIKEVHQPAGSPYYNVCTSLHHPQLVAYTGAPIHHNGAVDGFMDKLSCFIVDLEGKFPGWGDDEHLW